VTAKTFQVYPTTLDITPRFPEFHPQKPGYKTANGVPLAAANAQTVTEWDRVGKTFILAAAPRHPKPPRNIPKIPSK
jgi:hypothetical protein